MSDIMDISQTGSIELKEQPFFNTNTNTNTNVSTETIAAITETSTEINDYSTFSSTSIPQEVSNNMALIKTSTENMENEKIDMKDESSELRNSKNNNNKNIHHDDDNDDDTISNQILSSSSSSNTSSTTATTSSSIDTTTSTNYNNTTSGTTTTTTTTTLLMVPSTNSSSNSLESVNSTTPLTTPQPQQPQSQSQLLVTNSNTNSNTNPFASINKTTTLLNTTASTSTSTATSTTTTATVSETKLSIISTSTKASTASSPARSRANSTHVPKVSSDESQEQDWIIINGVEDATFVNIISEKLKHKYEENSIHFSHRSSNNNSVNNSQNNSIASYNGNKNNNNNNVNNNSNNNNNDNNTLDPNSITPSTSQARHTINIYDENNRITSFGKDGQDDGYADHVSPRPSLVTPSIFKHLKFYTLFLFVFANLVPTAALVVFYGLIPLGPVDGTISDKLVWILFINPLTFTAFSYIGCIIFCAALDDSVPWRPFSAYARILVACWVVETVFFLIFYGLFDSWHAMGLISIFLSMATTLTGLYLSQGIILPDRMLLYKHRFIIFAKVTLTVFIFVGILTLYTIAFKVGSSAVQSVLSLVIVFIAFGFKKYLLSLTDSYPIEISMLIAGLWVEHLEDVFVVVAYPTVNSSLIPFFLLAFSKFLQNAAYLLFLTDRWFVFRVWIKAFLKGFFTCHGTDPRAKPIENDDFEDRGHSNVKPGYHRRQVQFFMWKILSQLNGNILFLCISPILRYGKNSDYYPYSVTTTTDINITTLDESHYENSIFFCIAVFVMIFISGVLGYVVVSKHFPNIFLDLKTLYTTAFLAPVYFVFIIAIIFSNQLLAIAILQAQNRIWFWEYTVN